MAGAFGKLGRLYKSLKTECIHQYNLLKRAVRANRFGIYIDLVKLHKFKLFLVYIYLEEFGSNLMELKIVA